MHSQLDDPPDAFDGTMEFVLHFRQLVLPDLFSYWLGGHRLHELLAISDVYVPGSQSLHTISKESDVLLNGWYFPAEHNRHLFSTFSVILPL